VYSFDFVAVNERVTACDISKVPIDFDFDFFSFPLSDLLPMQGSTPRPINRHCHFFSVADGHQFCEFSPRGASSVETQVSPHSLLPEDNPQITPQRSFEDCRSEIAVSRHRAVHQLRAEDGFSIDKSGKSREQQNVPHKKMLTALWPSYA
jgi:hypothetical protein